MDLSQLTQTQDAVKAIKGGPSGAGAWFTAYALAPAADDPARTIGALQEVHEALKAALGWNAPTGGLRWIYAALLTGHGKSAADFLAVRGKLKESEKTSGAGKLYAGGARAALVLTLAGADSAHSIRRFYAIRQAIRPPWWRASPDITDLFAASHATRDDSPETVVHDRETAQAVFEAERATRGLKREGARLCALYQQPANDVLERYLALREAVKAHRKIRYAGNRHLWMEWAAQGVTPADLPVIEANLDALGKVTQLGSARLRLAQLVWLGERGDAGLGAVSAMSAVIAAQTAAIIAITSASTATVAATSAGR